MRRWQRRYLHDKLIGLHRIAGSNFERKSVALKRDGRYNCDFAYNVLKLGVLQHECEFVEKKESTIISL